MFKNKKGIIGILLNPFAFYTIIVIAILLVIFFIPIIGLGIFLAFNLLTFLGIFLVVISAIAISRGLINPAIWIMLIGGLVLVLMPFLSDKVASLSIGSVLR